MRTGEKIKEIRKYFSLTQRELGEKLGLRQQVIDYYEKRESMDSGKIVEICSTFGVPVYFFYSSVSLEDCFQKGECRSVCSEPECIPDLWKPILPKLRCLKREEALRLKLVVEAFIDAVEY